MMRKISAADIRSDLPLDHSRHDRTDYSSSKPSTLDYSGVFNERSSKRPSEPNQLSANRNKQHLLQKTPMQPSYKDNRKNVDESKYGAWTTSSFKISSPKSIVGGGSHTHRDYNRQKASAFHEQYQLPVRLAQNYQRPGAEKQGYKKMKSGVVQKENESMKREKKQTYEMDAPVRKDKFFQYILKYSYRSKKGYQPSNPSKPNQDAYLISTSIGKKSWQHYFGICDGHGNLGHHVSSFIKSHLPKAIQIVNGVEKSSIKDCLYKAFKSTNQKLVQQSGIDLSYSGSTVVGCYLNHNKLYCCNVGDSRAIIGCKKDNKWSVKQLSIDHKPSQKSQAERILKKGRIEQCKDVDGKHVGPLRVWLKQDNAPGLAMTRSFGDLVAASVGVSWKPQIAEFTLTDQDRIIIIGSDGVWEFLQNEDIISKLSPFYENNQIQQACDYLLDYANNSWTSQSPIVDDISFVMIFMVYTT